MNGFDIIRLNSLTDVRIRAVIGSKTSVTTNHLSPLQVMVRGLVQALVLLLLSTDLDRDHRASRPGRACRTRDVGGRDHALVSTVVAIRVLKVNILEVLVIETADLVLLAGTNVAAGDLIDDEEQDARDYKGPDRTGGGAGKLQTELTEVAVPPTSLVCGARHAVKGRHELGSKETCEKVANKAADAVQGKDIKAVVDGE